MQGYNHVAGGLVFTGIFSSFHDVNVFSSPLLIGTMVACALLPDIDHTQSAIGKTFYPVARYLQTRFGHRTVTHSLFFYLGCVCLLWLVPTVGPTHAYAICGAYALSSHLLFDMCTKQGVPLLYPFSKRPFVLPANPGLRLSAQDHRSEAIVFVVFLALGSFCQPLFANGFWTSYNQAFATWEHVERESRRSPDLLHVIYADRTGGKQQREGLFYKKDGTKIVVLTVGGFETFVHTEQPLTRFEHSGFVLQEQPLTRSAISLDSLNRLLTYHCARIQIQSTSDLTYFTGNLMQTGKAIDLTYLKNLLVSQLPADDSETITKIRLAQNARADEQDRYNRERQLYQRTIHNRQLMETTLRSLASEFDAASDYRKGEIIAQRKELSRKLETARLNEPLPPIPPNLMRYDLDMQLLKKQLNHRNQINAHLLIVSWKPLKINS